MTTEKNVQKTPMNVFGIPRKDAVKEKIRQKRLLMLKEEDVNITNPEKNARKCQENVYGKIRNVLKDKEATENVLVAARAQREVLDHTYAHVHRDHQE